MKPHLAALLASVVAVAMPMRQAKEPRILNTTRREKSLGGANRKAKPGAQMAHIRAARKARNQRRARIAARRGGK